MKDRTVTVWHQIDAGFNLEVTQPTWRSSFVPLGELLMGFTAKLWIPAISPVLTWAADKLVFWDRGHAQILATIPIDRETADKLAYHPEGWSWLDD
jgi:hypothetical protein